MAYQHIWSPAAYQGGGVSRRYFEGWYYKQVDAAGRQAVAVIPGVSFSADGSAQHAFVQVVPGGGEMHYFAFDVSEFSYDDRSPFTVRVGPNTFSAHGMTLDLSDAGRRAVGSLRFGPWSPWPVRLLSPGIMGWYRFVPRMETYHGVLSMNHRVDGSLEIDGQPIDFTGAHGYAEKDWGRSFPSSWIWAQSNTFDQPGTSITLSVAKVPWMTGAFVGTIAGLLRDGQLHRFATYTGARVRSIETGDNEAHVLASDRREELELRLAGSKALILKAPVLGAMEGRDAESLGGTIDTTLRAVRGGRAQTVFSEVGRQAGIEIMDERGELRRMVGPETRRLV